MRLVQGVYANAQSHVRVGERYSEEFEVKDGVHKDQYSARCSSSLCLKPSHESSALGSPEKTSMLMTLLSSLEECVRRLLTWKEAMEKKGLRVNAGKTKIMICGTGLDLLQSSGEFPCAICHTGVSSIFCNGCKHWVHKKCSGLKRLKKDPDYRCTRPQDTVTTKSNELLVWLSIEDLSLILKEKRLRWYGHVERSNGAVKTAFDIQVDGKHGPGRPKMTWKQLTERDCRECKLSTINPHDRHTWRSGVRSAMCAANQLSGRGPTSMDDAPVPAR